jgi:trans-2,3-dihydro-3-hydroxyanthranilate isomerase
MTSPQTLQFTFCDVFAEAPLEGNQLAVFADGRPIADDLQQQLAREINFSETVFVYPPEDPAHTARIRIYVPTAEIPFAGHPVIGTAVVIATERGLDEVVLETGVGPVSVDIRGNEGTMHQPVPTVGPFPHADALLAALRVERSELPVEVYDNGMAHIYVVLESPEAVAALDPDASALARLQIETGNEGSGFNVFAGSGTSWKTRMFAPAQIAGEDPATGSAAGPLACHVMRHGLVEPGTEITISQGVEVGRPSTLRARADGSPEQITAVDVTGKAVIVGTGQFTL